MANEIITSTMLFGQADDYEQAAEQARNEHHKLMGAALAMRQLASQLKAKEDAAAAAVKE